MKQPTETTRIFKMFFFCVLICLCIMFASMGFFKAKSNSEYALNGKKPEYVTGYFVEMHIINAGYENHIPHF